MLRVVRFAEGTVAVATDRRQHGRSAYVCATVACIEGAMARGRLARALKCALDGPMLDRLGEELKCKLR